MKSLFWTTVVSGLVAWAVIMMTNGCATVAQTPERMDTRWSVHQTTIADYYITKTTEDCHRCTFPMPQNDDVPLVKEFETNDLLMNIRIMWYEENVPMIGMHMVCPEGIECPFPERCVVLEFVDWDAMADFTDVIGDPKDEILDYHIIPCDGFLQSLEDQLMYSERDGDGRPPEHRGE